MPDFYVSPISIVNQIKSNLQDRYDSGYPILKELLQNADDSGAKRFLIDALPGWPSALNPLLRGPGLLVANNGLFRKEDERGITSFGESSKATDSAAIGKFGFGQKAVFHLCDAFIVHAVGEAAFSTVVNPFLGVQVDGNICKSWEPTREDGLDPEDLRLLQGAISSEFPDRFLIIWLPLRRNDLRPAPDVGFSSNFPHLSETISELSRPEELRILLTTLRHLEIVEIREHGSLRCAVQIVEADGRLLGSDQWPNGVRQFSGSIESKPAAAKSTFVGRETTADDGRLTYLQRTPHWPKTIDVRSTVPQPEKGQPHGAATLLRDPLKSSSRLRISWAVFLPISEESDVVVDLGALGLGEFRLLLHGYFFLDSGRRQIEGLTKLSSNEDPKDASTLRQAWNAELRDSVVLPLIPPLIQNALNKKMIKSAELSELVRSLASNPWFSTHKRAICKDFTLAQVVEGPQSIAWRLAPAGATLRPLPAAILDSPTRLEELFPSVHSWSRSKNTLLVVDKNASLSAEAIRWTASDLSELFAGLSPRAFRSRPLAQLLIDFLSEAALTESELEAIAPYLISALRSALADTAQLAPAHLILSILNYVPHGLLFPLPSSVEHRELLRAFATADSHILPVRREWLRETYQCPKLSSATLASLLTSIQSRLDSDSADQAATAALSFLVHAEHDVTSLVDDRRISELKILRARDIRAGRSVVLSLNALVGYSRAGFLFGTSVDANQLLGALAAALPNTTPIIVEGNAAQFLRESGSGTLILHAASKSTLFALINLAHQFGADSDRLLLLQKLSLEVGDDSPALRRLCAGDFSAGFSNAKLWTIPEEFKPIERVVKGVVTQAEANFLVPAIIADELSPRIRNHAGLQALDSKALQALFEKHVETIEALAPSEDEYVGFLRTSLPDKLLCELPIHRRMDGSIGSVDGVFRLTTEWSVPAKLVGSVPLLLLSEDSEAFHRQGLLVRAWSPLNQIEVALSQPNPHLLRTEILDALAALRSDDEVLPLLTRLRQTSWLLAEDTPFRPEDILALPPRVEKEASCLAVGDEGPPPFLPASKLAADIREHRGYRRLETRVLPDQTASFETLALLVEDAQLIGRLGPTEKYPTDDFIVLANYGSDLGLPGWPLLSASLHSLAGDPERAARMVTAFCSVEDSRPELAALYLDHLAGLAEGGGKRGEAARSVHFHGFGVIAGWPEPVRCKVFSQTRLPTEAGGWRTGQQVIQNGEGIDGSYVLSRVYASALESSHRDTVRVGGAVYQPPALTTGAKSVDLAEIEVRSVSQHRIFLEGWRGRVPSDLVITYIGLIGRGDLYRQLANEWRTDATCDVDTLWADLDSKFPTQVLYPGPLTREIDQRRFFIEQIAGQRVRATAMSADLFDAPLGEPSDGLIVGNLHRRAEAIRTPDGTVRSLITIPVRHVDLSGFSQGQASETFREFVETVAVDCLSLQMTEQLLALRGILDKTTKINQTTLEQTQRQLWDRLPTILAELKLPAGSAVHGALQNYQAAEGRLLRQSAPSREVDCLKDALWQEISAADKSRELLYAVRAKIHDLGYSEGRVLFELFQNADDAYCQLSDRMPRARFRVQVNPDDKPGLRVTHWGRPINHLGPDTREGIRLGYDRDLLNMLLMNFSEKRPGEDLTGKFGLGFKSVHIIADSVGIASGFIELRTAGGLLPTPWPNGISIAEAARSPQGARATVVDIPIPSELSNAGQEALRAFRASMAWLPAFAREIRQIEIDDNEAISVTCQIDRLQGLENICIVSLTGAERQRALRFDLIDGYSLLLRVDADGPCLFAADTRKLWNLAPLEENIRSGWLLNGPFPVDPGRGRLAGSTGGRQALFKKLGLSFGDRLCELYEFASRNWDHFAEALELNSDGASPEKFCSALFAVIERDLDDELARHFHGADSGYGRLAAKHPVVPTRLPLPFAVSLRAAEVSHYTDAALSDFGILEKVARWPTTEKFHTSTVSIDVAHQLEQLGFKSVRPVTLTDALRLLLGHEKRVDVNLAMRLGKLLSLEALRTDPLFREQREIFDLTRHAQFLASDGSWRPVRELSSDKLGNEDEELLCAFAPQAALLDSKYHGDALEFFRLARAQSGYGPQVMQLSKWAHQADSSDRRRAVLCYLIAGSQRRELANSLRANMPPWIPQPVTGLWDDPLLQDWTAEDRKRLVIDLGGHEFFGIIPDTKSENDGHEANPGVVLSKIYDWWRANGVAAAADYEKRAFPAVLSSQSLLESDDRTMWFSMFALACFQTIGRTRESQHRSFIEKGCDEGWWQDLAASRPTTDVQSWIDRLEAWSAQDQYELGFMPWRRTFVDLYSIARWLDQYIEIMRTLPAIIRAHRIVSLDEVLRPSYSPVMMPLGLDAAPLSRSLGIGINWMIREMVRRKTYSETDAELLAPYCWAPTQRTRRLYETLGADVGSWADKEASRSIHKFVIRWIGSEHSRFNGAFDLPIQLITQDEYRLPRQKCFEAAGCDVPDFEIDGEPEMTGV